MSDSIDQLKDKKNNNNNDIPISISTDAFEALQKVFEEVIIEFSEDHNLSKFKAEYEKLHNTLVKSHENEKRLRKKCQELQQQIVENVAKIQQLIKISQNDQGTIMKLQTEIEKTWKLVEASSEREKKAKESIKSLNQEIESLTKLLEKGTGINDGSEAKISKLKSEKEALEKQKSKIEQQLNRTINECKGLFERINELKKKQLEISDDNSSKTQKIADLKYSILKEKKSRQQAEDALKETKQNLKQKDIDIGEKRKNIDQIKRECKEITQTLKEQKKKTQQAEINLQIAQEQRNEKNAQLNQHIKENSRLYAESEQQRVNLEVKEKKINEERLKFQKIKKNLEKQQKIYSDLLEEKNEVERGKLNLQNQIKNLQKDMEKNKKLLEKEKQNVEDLTHQRNILSKKILTQGGENEKYLSSIQISEANVSILNTKLQAYRQQAEERRKEIFRLEKERVKYASEGAEAKQKYYQALEEVKIKTLETQELQKKILESQEKLKAQQALYEKVRSDRNMYSKNLIEAHEEVQDMNRKFKIMKQHIETLKEEISHQERQVVDAHTEVKKYSEENERLKDKLQRKEKKIQQQIEENKRHEEDLFKLNQIIKEADKESKKQHKEYEDVVNDRDILGTQLIRRNDELALLYEKIKIQQSALNKGASQYREKCNDIKMLRLKIDELRRKLHVLKKQVSKIQQLKIEIHSLRKQLLQEQTKVKGLSEELENPMNVHRWRKLEGSDPTAYEMILKIQTLQKRLIDKTEEVMEKDLLIQEKERLYEELKQILARQPGPEVAEQLNAYQQTLRKKIDQMKTMASELNMFKYKHKELLYENERVNKDLENIKKKYYTIKQKEQKQKQQMLSISQNQNQNPYPLQHPIDQKQFIGGGFGVQ